MTTTDDAKRAAVRQWSADPCGPEVTAEPGTAEHAEQLIAGRRDYAPWFTEALGYAGTSGMDVLDVGWDRGSTWLSMRPPALGRPASTLRPITRSSPSLI